VQRGAFRPRFPLEATVAVNPFLGQTGEDLATAAARLERVAGVSILQQRSEYAAKIHDGRISDEDLTDALSASAYKAKPATIEALKTFAAAPHRRKSQFADGGRPCRASHRHRLAFGDRKDLWPLGCGQFDRGQALWSPGPGRSLRGLAGLGDA
jgi:pyruvate/2-oxoglutarate dehydrogenase complex dihydrolipoamide acyltransferase (E2) component